jgi:hypothetical protein
MVNQKLLTYKSYFSHGLNIDSFIPLDGLVQVNSKPNVTITEGHIRKTSFYKEFPAEKIMSGSGFKIRADKSNFCVEWLGTGGCLIENGSTVTVELDPGVAQKQFEHLITGPISAILLHQKDRVVLHGSAINIQDKAIVFLGDKGYGKSTLAAHFQKRGHHLISDDLVPISFNDKFCETVPGHPKIRLYPDSSQSIGLNPNDLPRVDERFNKRYIKFPGKFSIKPVRIGCIFVLNLADEIQISNLNSTASFIEIVRNTFLNRFLEVTENSVEHFQKTQKIIQSVPVFRLGRPHDFSCMEKVTEKIKQHVQSFLT